MLTMTLQQTELNGTSLAPYLSGSPHLCFKAAVFLQADGKFHADFKGCWVQAMGGEALPFYSASNFEAQVALLL